MTNVLPYLQTLSAIGIAAGIMATAAIVWQVAKQRIDADRHRMRADLFDKRFAALMELAIDIDAAGKIKDRMTPAFPGIDKHDYTNLRRDEFASVPDREPGLRYEVVAKFRYLFGEDVLADVRKLHDLCLEVDQRVIGASRKLEAAFDRLLTKLDSYLALKGK